MQPEQYDAWYATQRGAWIGEEEYRLIASLLAPRPGETLLDAGCGTGYFTRRFAADAADGNVVGADIDPVMLRFAAGHSAPGRFGQSPAPGPNALDAMDDAWPNTKPRPAECR